MVLCKSDEIFQSAKHEDTIWYENYYNGLNPRSYVGDYFPRA